MFGLPEIAGGLIGSVAGNLLAGGSRKPTLYYTPQFINKMNELLDKSLSNALSTSTDYTNKAVNTLQQSKQDTSKVLQQYLKNALDQSQQLGQSGLNAYQTLQRPYAQAGYDALDAYRQTLGLSTPVEGSAAQVQNAQISQQLLPLLQSLQGNYNQPVFQAPTYHAPTIAPPPEKITHAQAVDYLLKNVNFNRVGYTSAENLYGLGLPAGTLGRKHVNEWAQNPYIFEYVSNAILNPLRQQYNMAHQQAKQQYDREYNAAQQQYKTQTERYNQVINLLNTLSPDQAQAVAYNLRGLFNA